ncbi:MAG: cytochrome-ba3 oxidase subunit [Haloferacaceae archaeon]
MASVNSTRLAALGLLALVPVAVYAVLRPAPIVVLSALCVSLIAGSIYVLFGSGDGERDTNAV